METKRFEFILEARSPIAHHAETFGNQAISFRSKIRMPDGTWASALHITADTMRHGLREAIAYVLLDSCGLLNDRQLSEAALRLLFAGGMVTGRGDASAVRLDQYAVMCDLVPPMMLFGGCASNRVIPGRLVVEDALLICTETKHIVPEWVIDRVRVFDSSRAHTELVQRVRMDPTLSPEKRLLLSSGAASDVENRLLQSEAAHDDDIAAAREATKSSMMPRSFERIAAGSLFSWAVQATTYSDLEVDLLHTTVAAFLANAQVGGKRGTGHGFLRPVEARGIVVNRPEQRLYEVKPTALAPKVGEMFRAHVRERAGRLKEFLSTVEA